MWKKTPEYILAGSKRRRRGVQSATVDLIQHTSIGPSSNSQYWGAHASYIRCHRFPIKCEQYQFQLDCSRSTEGRCKLIFGSKMVDSLVLKALWQQENRKCHPSCLMWWPFQSPISTRVVTQLCWPSIVAQKQPHTKSQYPLIGGYTLDYMHLQMHAASCTYPVLPVYNKSSDINNRNRWFYFIFLGS